MNILNFFAGLACLGLGTYITLVQIRKFKRGKQDQLGFDIKILGSGIVFIMGGLALVINAFG